MGQIGRHRGCLLGLAAGDALGTTLEFRPPGSFTPLSDMVMQRRGDEGRVLLYH